MKRKVNWDDEEEESGKEDNISSDDESDIEEPRIKDVLNNLSKAVSRKYASELLHSMATSKDILFWTPRGQLLRNQRIIPVTNISELVEYVLLPHNDDVAKPQQAYRDKEEEVDDGNSTDSNVEEETASEEGIGPEESQESDSDSDEETENSDSDSSALTQKLIIHVNTAKVRMYMILRS
ncbi:hypothetical protein ACROYT_G009279 [Oculina patagonica]